MFERRQLYNVIHPFIDSIYLKKEFNNDAGEKTKNVLVIETKRDGRKVTMENRNKKLLSFLADLDLIKDAVEKSVGKFDRLDIKYH